MIELNDLAALKNDPRLALLLRHYAELSEIDRQAWQSRMMSLGETTAAELSRCHGRLLAADWIEQQTGAFSRLAAGEVPDCYRATAAGRRAIRELTFSD